MLENIVRVLRCRGFPGPSVPEEGEGTTVCVGRIDVVEQLNDALLVAKFLRSKCLFCDRVRYWSDDATDS